MQALPPLITICAACQFQRFQDPPCDSGIESTRKHPAFRIPVDILRRLPRREESTADTAKRLAEGHDQQIDFFEYTLFRTDSTSMWTDEQHGVCLVNQYLCAIAFGYLDDAPDLAVIAIRAVHAFDTDQYARFPGLRDVFQDFLKVIDIIVPEVVRGTF